MNGWRHEHIGWQDAEVGDVIALSVQDTGSNRGYGSLKADSEENHLTFRLSLRQPHRIHG